MGGGAQYAMMALDQLMLHWHANNLDMKLTNAMGLLVNLGENYIMSDFTGYFSIIIILILGIPQPPHRLQF